MAIEFEFYQSPHTFGEKTKKYYPKVVNYRTVTTQELAEEIHSGSTLTTADIRATIDTLSYQIAQHLSESERVHVEGIGFFEVSLQCPETENPKETRAGKVKFKSVNFRADKALKEKMHKAQTIRSKRKVHSSAFSPEKMDEKLTVYFQTNLFLMRRDLEQLCGLTQITANRQLKRLIEEKKLKNIATRYHPVYVPMPGWYGKEAEQSSLLSED